MNNLKQYAAIWIHLLENNLAQVPGLDTEKHILWCIYMKVFQKQEKLVFGAKIRIMAILGDSDGVCPWEFGG